MTRFNILPYHPASQSAKNIRDSLRNQRETSAVFLNADSPRIQKLVSNGGFTDRQVFIAWGNNILSGAAPVPVPEQRNVLLLNCGDTKKYINKRTFFDTFCNGALASYLPKYWSDPARALEYLNENRNADVNKILLVERNSLESSGGNGIRFLNKNSQVDPNARLFTKYIPKAEEFRVHLGKSRMFAVQKKFLPRENLLPEGNSRQVQFALRNFNNGWRYQMVGAGVLPPSAFQACTELRNHRSFNLDFCAVDIIHNQNSGSSYILEVNTAPGVSEPLLSNYIEHFQALANNHNWERTVF